jgi:hypothetical protein
MCPVSVHVNCNRWTCDASNKLHHDATCVACDTRNARNTPRAPPRPAPPPLRVPLAPQPRVHSAKAPRARAGARAAAPLSSLHTPNAKRKRPKPTQIMALSDSDCIARGGVGRTWVRRAGRRALRHSLKTLIMVLLLAPGAGHVRCELRHSYFRPYTRGPPGHSINQYTSGKTVHIRTHYV